MDKFSEPIQEYYDMGAQREWERLERHPMEHALTWRTLQTYLPKCPAKILDCGGGPGRYAIELVQRGYRVTLFDLSPGNLELAQEKAAQAGVELAAIEEGSATDLGRFGDESFDAVLLMGPIYHLLEAAWRQLALKEVYRVLKPGGPAFVAFISRYAAHRRTLQSMPERIVADERGSQEILTSGRILPVSPDEPSFIAYLAHPNEIHPLLHSLHLEVETVLGVEGLASLIDDNLVPQSPPVWKAWVDLNYHLAGDPCIHGCVEHLLAVARKPKWRSVLRSLAAQLDREGIRYKVVGGSCLALQGVDVPVKDIDIELPAEQAYRFQDLFAAQAEQPVALSQNASYRSHFGRFNFDGVSVEVMGDIHRLDGEHWVSTATMTETVVEIDGIPVRTAWLEEETLANIRRGRMERAAQCLKLCNTDRLLALMRGEKPTQVL